MDKLESSESHIWDGDILEDWFHQNSATTIKIIHNQ